jgi:hypothetical protein
VVAYKGGLANLKPELIGLAAWLCVNEYTNYSAGKILKHAAAHGTLDGLQDKACIDGPEDFALASQALAEGKRLVVELESQPSSRLPQLVFSRNGNSVPVNHGPSDDEPDMPF